MVSLECLDVEVISDSIFGRLDCVHLLSSHRSLGGLGRFHSAYSLDSISHVFLLFVKLVGELTLSELLVLHSWNSLLSLSMDLLRLWFLG